MEQEGVFEEMQGEKEAVMKEGLDPKPPVHYPDYEVEPTRKEKVLRFMGERPVATAGIVAGICAVSLIGVVALLASKEVYAELKTGV